MYLRLSFIAGPNVGKIIATLIAEKATDGERVMVILDNNHTYGHVLGEYNLNGSLDSVAQGGCLKRVA